MFMEVDYIRVWQDTKTMSYGCDPASHPTKEFIKAHITNYTDPRNHDIVVAGGASCNSNDDCTAVASVTGACVEHRCQCNGVWTGPRCTKYDLDTVTYGPSAGLIGGVLAAVAVASVGARMWRRRHDHAVLQNHEIEVRREKRSSCSAMDADAVNEPLA
ncbi:hypothetical protein SDRG_11829 [Saprolegnia diclina VS20]|uniref:EGF-like domain-containing protein n=1 Tax=Saprolegnia diclina (strain VS20) TaxID=1156394 RepID=T0RKU8_SAPDV|nr:hypothetical protein SDRG_11829 [Saprolegnia diclina VS20]EQC30512.1 hypothetical protein SDRG_11829 [Saprolegnia diclina VS20]|eukprot:XP_008616105.1 hypothetical protein SDRG_11829 [Saprolegnia diclina VS20]